MTTVNKKQIKGFENDLLEYIKKQSGTLPHRPPKFGITTNEYASSEGIAESTARRALKQLVKDKKLARTVMNYNGRVAIVYHRK